ncbi:TetR/AcrR family transcriptional regulator [Chelatococcus sp. YT9]|uniref:TetR/AcrR family transcriptional regulator n=1 Tax=Chelatococcus sp. YT9 TaxID=2835635 RepID=UPI001BCE6527|nr:TetR/AcrR family transcriptional regulator [Chelatococcus sp. YT9]MBS7697162.1 TetR/AcrR family transcriptional regulator [Chelatococcus sp. YT9]
MSRATGKPDARSKLLDAALILIRAKGYSATSVDELCTAAGVTKGAFFHHFKSKDELAVAAADYWSQSTGSLFAAAPYHDHADPLDRVLGYVDFRKELLQGDVPEFTCLVGTMVQEAYGSTPSIREACERSIAGHAATLEADIQAAIDSRGLSPDWSAKSLALHTQAVLQGAFILAKATGGAGVAAESISHLRRYLELLFRPQPDHPLSETEPRGTYHA